jgi:hypothetical protein
MMTTSVFSVYPGGLGKALIQANPSPSGNVPGVQSVAYPTGAEKVNAEA